MYTHKHTHKHTRTHNDYKVSLDSHFHRVVQCTLKDRHNHKYQGPVFHHSYSSFPHSLENEDEWRTAVSVCNYICILCINYNYGLRISAYYINGKEVGTCNSVADNSCSPVTHFHSEASVLKCNDILSGYSPVCDYQMLTFTELSSVLWRTDAIASIGVLCSTIHTVLCYTIWC